MIKKHKFKVGDKVKLVNPSRYRYGNLIGVVKLVNANTSYIFVTWNSGRCLICNDDNCRTPVRGRFHKKCELKKAIEIGEQLMFGFMRGN